MDVHLLGWHDRPAGRSHDRAVQALTPPDSLQPILAPRSIAVIGASRTPGTIGHEIVRNLIRSRFTGPVYPVNPFAAAICAIPAWPEVEAIPGPVDQAVIVVPQEMVQPVAEAAIRKGVRGLVVISAGFREVGGAGAEREETLTRLVRSSGVRMVGPNCMGVLNSNPAVAMNGTFATALPPYGKTGFVSQSGALGLSVLDYAREYGIGISQFVSVGNKPDVSGNDLLLAWEHDPEVQVILMYVESFGNPARFLEIAGRITRTKPIIVVKSGRSRAGARAASSHTGALAASDAAVDALLAQAGVLRAGTIEELFDLAIAFSARPPKSRRTAVLTNAGGPGILAADACEANGLELPELAPETGETLRPLFPPYASVGNPLDMIASATPQGYRAALGGLLSDPGVDAALAIFVPPLGVSQEDVTVAIASVSSEHPEKPVFGVLMGHDGLPQGRAQLHDAGIPAYIFPESAARGLAALSRWREQQARPAGPPELLAVDRDRAAKLVSAVQRAGRTRLAEDEALAVLAAYGIGVAPGIVARSAEQAAGYARTLGFPVVLKIVAPDIIHKSDVGGVVTGLRDPGSVRSGFDRIMTAVQEHRPGTPISGILVQPQVEPGREFIAGMTLDPGYGPLVMFGLGGVLVEVLKDVTFRLAPLNRYDAAAMLKGIRGTGMLDALRGSAPVNRTALEDVLLRVSQLVGDFPAIRELDINPLIGTAGGAVAADARILISAEPVVATPA